MIHTFWNKSTPHNKFPTGILSFCFKKSFNFLTFATQRFQPEFLFYRNFAPQIPLCTPPPHISVSILSYHDQKKNPNIEIVQFYYFSPFRVWTITIVLLLLHWPHPASAHLLQQGDVYLQQEEIKALLHEPPICKSHTVQIDWEARAEGQSVLGFNNLQSRRRWGNSETHMWRPKKKKIPVFQILKWK